MKKLTEDPARTTDYLIRALLISVERRVTASCIVKLDPSAKNAATVKKTQRDERNALKALKARLKDRVELVKGSSIGRNPPTNRRRPKQPENDDD
jgi:hypothetical protein